MNWVIVWKRKLADNSLSPFPAWYEAETYEYKEACKRIREKPQTRRDGVTYIARIMRASDVTRM